MKSFATPNQWSYTDLFSTGRTMNHKFSLLWLMLFTLLLLPTRMVAQTTTEDSRCALFNDLDGITNVTITDNGDYPWKMLDLNAEGMKNLGFTFPDESKVLMSSNYHVNKSSSETVVNFTVEKPIVLTFKFLVSTDVFDKATVTLDNKEYGNISEKNQIEVKALLPVGEHSLKLSYKKNTSGSSYADRVFIYDLNTATNISDYVAVYDATNQTLTFKKNSSNNLESLDLSRTVIVDNEPTVKNLCSRLGINNNTTIKSVVFDKSFNEYAPTSLEGFFQDCKGLETILGLEYLNTANVTSMYNMFKNCQKLSSLTLSESFNTAKVTNMAAMFYGCKNLSSLNLSNFNTANVTNMSYIFTNCNNLSSLTLSNFNTAKVTNMAFMFQDCNKLSSLDLSNFNTANVTNMSNMFYGCNNLSSLTLSNFNTAKVTNMSSMFNGCNNLSSLTLSNFNTAKVTNMAFMFQDCNKLSSLDLSNFNTENVTVMYNMFSNCKNLSSLTLSESFNTAKVTNMLFMFSGCNNLSSLDLSEFNTANVKNMSSMFRECYKLSSLTLSNSFNTAKVTNMSYMFSGCQELPSLDLSMFNTANVMVMYNMFSNCKNLSSLTLSESFNTAKVTSMQEMFSGCNKLSSLDLSNFNTAKVTSMQKMFSGCNNLSSLDFSKFNTAEVTDMSFMFFNCTNLSSLDLSNFNTENVTNMESMFKGCSTLQSIYVSDNFVVTAIKYESSKKNLFTDCNALKGALPKYDPTKTSSDYANYKTGYFTKLVGKNGSDKIGAVGEVLTAESIALADDKDLVVYEPFTATAATYNRTINANTTWATLCLPFEVSLDGQNFRAFKLLSADEGTNTVELEELTTSIEAGTPVIIKMNEGANSLKFSVENTAIAKDIQTAATADGNYQLQGLYAQKVFDKDVDNNCYIVKGDKLMNPAKLLANTNVKKVASKPFRAYMVGNSSAPAAGAKMFSIGFNDNTTAIDNLNTIANDKAVYYDIQGLRLNAPQKGINIVKRGNKTMKVIIK